MSDFYSILEVAQMADEATIKASYKRLALLKHPDKDRNNPRATAEFQTLQRAYETLSDPLKRLQYDISFRSTRQSAGGTSKPKPTYYSNTQGSSPKPPSSSTNDEESRRSKERVRQFVQELAKLHQSREVAERGQWEAKRNLAKVQTALDKLKAEDDEDAREVAEKKTWFAYFFNTKDSEMEKEARERRAAERRTGRIVQEVKLDKCKAEVDATDSAMCEIKRLIERKTAAKDMEEQRERWRQERLNREREQAEQRRREEEDRKARAKAAEETARRQREWEAREAEERKKETKAAEEFARLWREQQAKEKQAREQRAREAQEREKRARQKREMEERAQEVRHWEQQAQRAEAQAREAKARLKKAKKEAQGHSGLEPDEWTEVPVRTRKSGKSTYSSCDHKEWWDRVQGQHLCENCSEMTYKFILECPGCSMLACANCKIELQRNGRGGR